jgi:hypothetical protein
MKLKLFNTFALCIAIFAVNAQMAQSTASGNVQNTAVTSNQAEIAEKAQSQPRQSFGSLLSMFSGQVSPGGYTDAFSKDKSDFQTKAKSSVDAKANSGLLQNLEAGIKSSSFKSAWAGIKDKWLANVKAATTNQQLAGYLKTLSENVDPKLLGSTWGKVSSTFDSSLDKISN